MAADRQDYTVVLIVPTGIGAKMGGYAGDALPIARAFAANCSHLITHPNVMNGAMLYWPIPNALYVEGFALDRFAGGNWGLSPVKHNRVGLIFDRAIEDDLRIRHLQVADATRASLGLDLTDYIITDVPLGVSLRTAASGASWGTISEPDSLLSSAEKLIKVGKAEAIAVVTRFPDDLGAEVLQNYRYGQGVDPLAGAEAVISHLIVKHFNIPCAHAPALSPLPLDENISPRSSAEELGYTFLPCVLVGLSRAPQFTQNQQLSGSIWAKEVNAVIIPESACGGSALLSFSQSSSKIITVAENETRMSVTPESLGIKVIKVRSYLEALGVIAIDRLGMSLSPFSPEIDRLKPI